MEGALKNPGSVYKLSLHNQGLSDLPENLRLLTNLKHLSLKGNNFTVFPIVVSDLSSLEYLCFAENKLVEIPSEISKLVNLEVIDLAENKFTIFPRFLCDLDSLKILKIEGNQIEKIDASIGKLKMLEYLLLGIYDKTNSAPVANPIKELPKELMECKSLIALSIWGTSITNFTPEQLTFFKEERIAIEWLKGQIKDPSFNKQIFKSGWTKYEFKDGTKMRKLVGYFR